MRRFYLLFILGATAYIWLTGWISYRFFPESDPFGAWMLFIAVGGILAAGWLSMGILFPKRKKGLRE